MPIVGECFRLPVERAVVVGMESVSEHPSVISGQISQMINYHLLVAGDLFLECFLQQLDPYFHRLLCFSNLMHSADCTINLFPCCINSRIDRLDEGQ